MKTELYRAIKEIDTKKLANDDLKELLSLFMVTKNPLIRNHIALIFADLNYTQAVPHIIKKINDKNTFNNNGTLVYSLQEFDLRKYFKAIVNIICEHEYEARLMAYGILEKLTPLVSNKIKSNAIEVLEKNRLRIEQTDTDIGENSRLHFIEKTEQLIRFSIEHS
jgi:hypothetical protein